MELKRAQGREIEGYISKEPLKIAIQGYKLEVYLRG